jgi:hypothetical protein
MKSEGSPRNYESFADFEREELRPMNRLGFSVADLEAEAVYKAFDEHTEAAPDELDFG